MPLSSSRKNTGMSSNGRTAAFGAVYFGSNPSVPAKFSTFGRLVTSKACSAAQSHSPSCAWRRTALDHVYSQVNPLPPRFAYTMVSALGVQASQQDRHQTTVSSKKARFCLLSVILFWKVSDRTLVIQRSFLPSKIRPFDREDTAVR